MNTRPHRRKAPRSPSADTGYHRYAGYILGFGLNLLAQPFMAPRYPRHRARIAELADDLGLALALPGTHRAYRQRFDGMVAGVAAQLERRAQVLVDFFEVGSLLLLRLVSNLAGEKLKPAYGEHFRTVLEDHGTDVKMIEWLLKRHARRAPSTDQEYELLSTAYEVLALILEEAPMDERTVFVVMPFSAPFPAHYQRVFRPVLARAGLRPVRAWEGVGGERYLYSVQALMSICRGVLAILSPSQGGRHPNLNVVHEIGMAQGMGHRVVVLREMRPLELPSNLDPSLMLPFFKPGRGPRAHEQLRFLSSALRRTFAIARAPKKLHGERRFERSRSGG